MSQPPPPPSQPPSGDGSGGAQQEPKKNLDGPQPPEGGGYGYPQQPPAAPQSGGVHEAPTMLGAQGPPPPPGAGGGQQPPPPPGMPPQQPPQGGYGYPQQPPQGGGYGFPQQPPQGGYGFPQQPPQGGGYGFPQQPPQGGYGYPQQGQPPYGQGPGMYPTAPPGAFGPGGPGNGSGGGNGKIIAIIAAAVAVVLVIGTVGWFLVKDDDGGTEAKGDTKGSSEGSTGGGGGGGGHPVNQDAKELFKIDSPKITDDDPVSVVGAWATDKTFAKATVNGIIGIDAAGGKQSWKLPLDGEVCAASRQVTKSGKAALIFAETKSSRAACSQIAVIDLDSGKKDWQAKMPGSDDASTLGLNMTISQDVVAAKWLGGSVAYKMSGGSALWKSKGDGDCKDEGFAGGKELMAVVSCGYDPQEFKVQKLNPKTGKSTWEFEPPKGVQSVSVISTDPVVLAVGAGTTVATDIMTVGEDAKLKAKISLGDHKYEPGCGTEVESCATVAADKDNVYLPSGEHQGDTSSTNEILAFDFNTGKPKWKSDAGGRRTIVPVRMDGDKLIAYKKPTYDAGGQIVGIDPAQQGKQTVYMRNPDASAETENNFAGITMREPPIYVNGRLFLQQTLISKDSTDSYAKYLGIGFGVQ